METGKALGKRSQEQCVGIRTWLPLQKWNLSSYPGWKWWGSIPGRFSPDTDYRFLTHVTWKGNVKGLGTLNRDEETKAPSGILPIEYAKPPLIQRMLGRGSTNLVILFLGTSSWCRSERAWYLLLLNPVHLYTMSLQWWHLRVFLTLSTNQIHCPHVRSELYCTICIWPCHCPTYNHWVSPNYPSFEFRTNYMYLQTCHVKLFDVSPILTAFSTSDLWILGIF